MALFNYASKEITLKVVYYGPGLCGKTTNLQQLHEQMSSDKKGKLLSLSTDADRTLFFDFMPVQLGKIKDFNIRFQLYTVPGQVRYNATRKLVLKGADAVVFVADSQTAMKEQNIDSLQNMKENLIANNINPEEVPVVLQYNKRDLTKIMPVAEMDIDLNPKSEEIIEASAYEAWGVEETFKIVTKRLLKFISKKHNVKFDEDQEEIIESASPVPPSKDRVNISVEDKANRLLEEEPVAVKPEPVAAQAVDTSDWDSVLDDQGSSDAGSSDWNDGGIDLESGSDTLNDDIIEPVAVDDNEHGTSELERMLMDEESTDDPAAFEEPEFAQTSSASIDALVAKVEELTQENEKIKKDIAKIKEQIKPVLQLLRKKRPVK
jgi:hypothetical protein